MTKKENSAAAANEAVYTKEQILSSGKYAARRDLLNALLKDGAACTLAETDKLIEKFMKGKVK